MEPLKNKKILLVDDDQSIRLSLSYYFQKKCGSFVCRETAEEALDHLRTEAYDIILCDYRLPGMDGLTYFQELHRLDLPVLKVLITAHGDLELAITAIKTGVHDFIMKPFNAHTVEESLIKLLEKKPKQTPALLADGATLEEIQQHLQAKQEFVWGKIAHKMNNILQSLAGNADMGLLELGAGSPLTKRFNNIISGIEAMMELTKEMTHVCKQVELKPEVIDVAALVAKIILKYNDILKRHGIQLYKCFEANINVTTYPEYLYNIIDNIILNAIQSLVEESKKEKVLNLYLNKEGSTVQIKIVDNSRGMGPDILAKATMEGFTTKASGNGSGLHLVDILSRKIGATINMKSEPGRGTNVKITLPLATPGVAAGHGGDNLPNNLLGCKFTSNAKLI